MAEKLDQRQQEAVRDIVAGKLNTLRACRCSRTRDVLEAAYVQVRCDPKKSALAQELRDQIATFWPDTLPLSA